MSKIDIDQGSKEWLELRRKKVTATDVACLMGVGFDTPYQRWLKKVSGEEIEVNADMQRGKDLEPEARAEAERIFGVPFYPETHLSDEHPWAMASLDGISPCGKLIEIKCPRQKGHEMARSRIIPDYYIPQMQWQMHVTKSFNVNFISYFEGEVIILMVHRDQAYIDELVSKACEFHDCILNLRPPVLTDKDTREISLDPRFESLADLWKNAKEQMEQWEELESQYRKSLQEYAKDGSVRGSGIKISRMFRKGNVDYSAIPELKGVDLEPYRKSPSEIYRFSLD